MNILSSLLIKFASLGFGATGLLAANIADDARWATEWVDFAFMKDFLVALNAAAWPFMAVVFTVSTLYAIILGVKLAKAEGKDAADAKKKIRGTITTLIAIVVIIMLYQLIIIPNLANIFAFISSFYNTGV